MNPQELKLILARANDFKEGDLLVGGTRDVVERSEARQALESLRVSDLTRTELVEDKITETLARIVDADASSAISGLRIGELKSLLLGSTLEPWLLRYRDGLSSEVIAAVVRLMTNEELSLIARALFNPLSTEDVAIGSRSHFGSRIQPNSAGDNEEEILFSIFEGLSYGCGDVILGLNPASDDLDTIVRLEELLRQVKERLELPTRYCVLSDIVKQNSARAHARVDVGFQSLAGTSRALVGMVGLDLDGLLDQAKSFDALYFETGQGSAVTNGADEGVDMVTLEARAYGVARYIKRQSGAWMIVNDVAGFIGPEVFRSADQLLRACLEDTVMAKLHGLTMGLDVCSTFHMGIEPGALRRLTETIVEQAAPAYLMAVPGNADPMLGYLTTSFREHPQLRRLTRKQVSSAMLRRFSQMGIISEAGELRTDRPGPDSLYAAYAKAGGDHRSSGQLREEGARRRADIRERGLDIGYDCTSEFQSAEADARLEAIYQHARRALYASIDEGVIRSASLRSVSVRTSSIDRDDFLSHPRSGEMLGDADAARIHSLYSTRRPRIQIVVSDGLNAAAVNENLHDVLPALRGALVRRGIDLGEIDVIVENGRVRAGYHVGALLEVDVIVHLIGERPGTGLNTLSAYLTYGRDKAGRSRWSRDLDHSATTAVCGINQRGKHPSVAVDEIANGVARMLEERRSGVEP
jgi:ethanolamine ammonia-lyase large subunit